MTTVWLSGEIHICGGVSSKFPGGCVGCRLSGSSLKGSNDYFLGLWEAGVGGAGGLSGPRLRLF